jgi:hypothetical protein
MARFPLLIRFSSRPKKNDFLSILGKGRLVNYGIVGFVDRSMVVMYVSALSSPILLSEVQLLRIAEQVISLG